MLSFTPTVNFTCKPTDKEALIASASYVVHIASLSRYTLDENGRIFESHWVVNSKLPVIICPHRIHIVVVGDEDRVRIATRQQTDRDIVGAEFG